MGITTGILLFEEMEELDVVGPWEVFGMAAQLNGADRVLGIAEGSAPVRCAKGLRYVPDATLADAPALDVLVVPGGWGTRREVDNAVITDWIRKTGASCRWVTSVCTGALLLQAAGFLDGRRATTHWASIEWLRGRGNVTVLENTRYVRDGNVVTSAGVSAGIDMSLWLIGQLYDADFARSVQRAMEYDPAPPYAAAV